jgi:aminomethyltransferase
MIRATPFHTRSAAANAENRWCARNAFTLSLMHSGVAEEALAARTAVVIADISWRWRVMLEGPRAGDFLSHLTTRNANALAPGEVNKALWLNDAGGLRGAGVVARYGRAAFLLVAAAPDPDWILPAAARFDVVVHEKADAGLAIIGPEASAVIAAAGLDVALEPLAFRRLFWRGLDITLSRWGEHGGYEIWCEADDAVVVWDRLSKAGRAFGMLPAGTMATDILDMEAGVARPHRDYKPADDAGDPSPKMLRLEKLIEDEHALYNGRAAYLAASPTHRIVGVEIDSEMPAPDAVVFRSGRAVGRMLTSLYSPGLRRAIGWARLEESSAAPRTRLSLMFGPDNIGIGLKVADLPFLPTPAPITA